jgi:hypothetical protein
MPSYCWAEVSKRLPLVDLLSFEKQIFQGSVPDLSAFFVDKIKGSECWLVIPHDAKFWDKEYERYVRGVAKFSNVIYFDRGDKPRQFNIPNAVALANSKKSDFRFSSIIVPYNVMDLGHIPIKHFSPRCSIGFVGYIPPVSLGRLLPRNFSSIRNPIRSNGLIIRKAGIRSLKRDENQRMFDINIVLRAHYGGAASLVNDKDVFRAEYVSNLERSNFIFSPRGDANSSQRLYEAISAGRIPIIPNSQMQLPRLETTSWSSIFLEVDTFSFKLGKVVSNYWSSTTEDQYLDLQKRLRNLYQHELDYRVYMKKMFAKGNFQNLIQ